MRFEWGELASHLGLSRSMLDMVRKGNRNLSIKALRRLEECERETGILPPIKAPSESGKPDETGPIKKHQISEIGPGYHTDELRAILDQLNELAARVERMMKK